MEHDCLFCKILKKEIPSESVYENENVFAFKDLYPQAKEHVLFIHKNHSKSFKDMPVDQINQIMSAIKEYTENISDFRIVTNIGPTGGQSVFHTHFHVLSGEQLRGFGK